MFSLYQIVNWSRQSRSNLILLQVKNFFFFKKERKRKLNFVLILAILVFITLSDMKRRAIENAAANCNVQTGTGLVQRWSAQSCLLPIVNLANTLSSNKLTHLRWVIVDKLLFQRTMGRSNHCFTTRRCICCFICINNLQGVSFINLSPLKTQQACFETNQDSHNVPKII